MSTVANQPAVAAGDADEFGGTQSLLKRVVGLQAFWILGVLIVICLFFTVIAGDRFLSTGNFSLISQNVAVWAVIGVGMTFVIITSGIDLSVGSVLVFSSVVAAKVMEAMGGNGFGVAAVGLVAAILSGMVWGVVNGVLVAMAKVPALIVTLGTLSVALGLAQVITGGIDIRSVPNRADRLQCLHQGFGHPRPAVRGAGRSSFSVGILLHKTRFGRYTYAIGSNEEAARRTGIKVTRHLVLVYALAGTLAGLGALLSLAQYGTTTIAGQSLTNLNVIAAVVIGGTSIFGGFGTIFGTVVGLFIPAVLQSGFVIIGVQPFWQGVAVGSVLIAAVYVDQTRRAAAMRSARSRSLFKRRGSEMKGKPVNRKRVMLVAGAVGAVALVLPMAACTSSKPQSERLPAKRRTGPRPRRPRRRRPPLPHRQKASKNYNIAVPAGCDRRPVLHHHAVRCAGGSRQARRQGKHAGPAEVRSDAAEADPRLDRREQARRAAGRTDRRPGHAAAASAGGRRRDQGGPRRHHHERPVVCAYPRSPATTRVAARRPSTPSSNCTPRAARSW